ncbi:synaptotagmin-5 [Selaginella moellendorffii]|nr:synaptotagmin-5 [Selaginella moellendorffii]|eukprot:XP_002985728.2 synaptotagmin-5 [Selaginella moellendorffii]
MGLLTGLLFGVIVGIGLVAGWCFAMRCRSKQRIAKAANIKLLGKMSQDEVKKLLYDAFPPWVIFPEFERVKWMNKQLEKVWPYVAGAAQEIIRESVEPVLEQYRPIGISSLKFDKLSLGRLPPQIEGIRIQTLKPGQITMDMDFRWNGDASIILGIQTLVGASLPVQLKNLKFFATIRVIFQLSENIPCISAVVVALLAKPKPEVKYTLKVIGGSLTGVPGLADMIKDLVEDAITDQLEWPHRRVIPIGGLPVDISDLELKLQGRLTVGVIKANSLKNMEMFGRSDPYVVAYVRPLFKFKTKVVNNNLNPEWNEEFNFDIEDHETQLLTLQVYDEDVGQKDALLGIVSYRVAKLLPEETKEEVLDLLPSLDKMNVRDKKDRGTITVRLKYHVYTPEEQKAAMEMEKKFLEEKQKAKEAGMIGSTMDAVGGGLTKAGKFVGKTVSTPFGGGGSRKAKSPAHENGIVRAGGPISVSKWFNHWKKGGKVQSTM